VTAGPIAVAPVPVLVYFARDGLPPIAAAVPGSGSVRDRPEDAIGGRLSALWSAQQPSVPAGAFHPFAKTGRGANTGQLGTSIGVEGDLATVTFDIPAGWGVSAAAETNALVQQLVYTITEEPGIRRALIKEKGKANAMIGPLVIDKPLMREDVFGYREQGSRAPMRQPDGAALTLSHAVTTDGASALARVVFDTGLKGGPAPGGFPAFAIEVRPNDDERAPAQVGKWILSVTFLNARASYLGMTVDDGHGIQIADGGPLRAVHLWQRGPAAAGVRYDLYVDDLRPWRTALAFDPVRLIVDIGGTPSTIFGMNAVYSPKPGETVGRSFTVSGVEHNFEANVDLRVRDATGRIVLRTSTTGTNCCDPGGTFERRMDLPPDVSGPVTLEVYESSARDGSDTRMIAVPLTVR